MVIGVFGGFDLNSTPLAPSGRKIISHEKLTQCTTWIKHGVAGWYI